MQFQKAIGRGLLLLVPLAVWAAQETLPDARAVVGRYVEAMGGHERLAALNSRVIKGRLLVPAGEAPFEIYEKAPDKFLRQIDSPAGGLSRNGFDGNVAWSANRAGVREMSGPEVDSFKREYCVHREIRLPEFYPEMAVSGRAKLQDQDVYVLTASPAETFYFDVQSGLLLRWDLRVRDVSVESYYEDYRDVDGVKAAFRIRHRRSDGFQWTDQADEIRHNVGIDDANFVKPPETPASPSGAAPPARRRSLVPDTFTNLQVLPKDISKNNLVEIMRNFCFTMDKLCSYCHVATDDLSQADFPSDEKEPKKKARELLRLILEAQKPAAKP